MKEEELERGPGVEATCLYGREVIEEENARQIVAGRYIANFKMLSHAELIGMDGVVAPICVDSGHYLRYASNYCLCSVF